MKKEFTLDIPMAWNFVAEVRQLIDKTVLEQAPALCAAASMVASELVENAIKYGEYVPAAPRGRIHFMMSSDKIVIAVSSGLRPGPSQQSFLKRIDRIAENKNMKQLALERMKELISQPDQHGQLGLYRIAYEAGFDLSYTYENEVLIVQASKSIVRKRPERGRARPPRD